MSEQQIYHLLESVRHLILARKELEAAAVGEPWGSELFLALSSDLGRIRYLASRLDTSRRVPALHEASAEPT